MKLHFWGATDDVTGSMTFIQDEESIVMVDAGLVQGNIQTEKLNLVPTPFDPKKITSIFVTHAHLDHSGYLPRLVRKGFRGDIYCTPPTAQLMQIILKDSASLSDDEFYDEKDVSLATSMVKVIEWNQIIDLGKFQIRFLPSGHILGASSVFIQGTSKSILFSGDLGRHNDPLLPDYENAPKADVLVMESTYGNRIRKGDIKKELHSFLATISADSRVGIIATFAVARAQLILTLIHQFFHEHPEFKVRVVADSPMMKEANQIYKKYADLTLFPQDVFESMNEIDMIDYHKEWETLKKKTGPLIILSSSGMLTGGRIARHLANWQNDEKAILFLPGYQGKGTPGRAFIEGSRNITTENQENIHWKGEVWSSEAFSSHGDQNDLIQWAQNNNESAIFLLHGETEAKLGLKQKLRDVGCNNVEIPNRGSIYSI